MSKPCCGNCPYVQKPKTIILDNTDLECRRYPPTMCVVSGPRGMATVSTWAKVQSAFCCGEHPRFAELAKPAALDAVSITPGAVNPEPVSGGAWPK